MLDSIWIQPSCVYDTQYDCFRCLQLALALPNTLSNKVKCYFSVCFLCGLTPSILQILRVLMTVIDTSTDTTALAVACYDLSQFLQYHPSGRLVVADLKAKGRVMKLMNHDNAEVRKNSLLCVQRLFLGAKYASFLQV